MPRMVDRSIFYDPSVILSTIFIIGVLTLTPLYIYLVIRDYKVTSQKRRVIELIYVVLGVYICIMSIFGYLLMKSIM